MKYTCLGIVCISVFLPFMGHSQITDTVSGVNDISSRLSGKYISDMGNRSAEYQEKMQASTAKYLDRLKAEEQTMQQQVNKIDPAAANRIFAGAQQSYDNIQNDLKNNAQNVLKGCGKYIPGVDSAITSLKFLQQGNSISGKLTGQMSQVTIALSKVNALEDQFKKTDNVEDFIKQREDYLQQQLGSYNIPGLQQFKQQSAYFAQQMADYKAAWDDPSRMEAKAMTVLNQIPAFQNFMKKNSMIAGLFNLPDDYATNGLAGLQTKDQIQKLMQQQMQLMGPKGGETAQQNIADAQGALSSLRSKLNQGGSSDLSMPDGQMNNQHTKIFLKRIQYGISMQSIKANFYFPNQTTFFLTAGYKINSKNTIGIGINYSVGWGRDIQHISISSQAIGFQSFGDFKIKGSFYGSAIMEYNYSEPFRSFSQLSQTGLWEKSGLIGLTKMVSIKSNLVKNTKLQLLWNFLAYYQVPRISQPLVFRVGYNF